MFTKGHGEYESTAVGQSRITAWAVTSDKVIVQISLHRAKINDKAMRIIKGEKGSH